MTRAWMAVCVGLFACGGDASAHGNDGADAGNNDAGTSRAGTDAMTNTAAHDASAAGGDAQSAASTSDAGAASSTGTGIAGYFPSDSFFREDVSGAPKAANSDRAIAALRARGGFGNGDVMQIDFSIDVLSADATTPKRTYTPHTVANGFDDDEYATPDCDLAPMPVPPAGHVEGEDGYACTGDGDCHLIVWSKDEGRLYEMWRASIDGSVFSSACLVQWDAHKTVGMTGRGLQCTSADAAGFPIAPLLFTADEVAAGEIGHAIRFILPNDRVQRGFVPPATHGSKTTGSADAPFYGVHLRLRADYPLASLPNDAARVVARAMQRYGMYHADGGDIALTAQSDQNSTAKWDGLLAPRDLSKLRVEDFEVIDHGPSVPLTFDCVRE